MLTQIHSATDTFFVILGQFLLFYPTTTDPENSNLEKMQKTAGDIIPLHMCTINQDHIMYGS